MGWVIAASVLALALASRTVMSKPGHQGQHRYRLFTIVSILALVASFEAPASAMPLRNIAGPVNGAWSHLGEDGTCPPNAVFPRYVDQHEHFEGLIDTRGPTTRLTVDVCTEFRGAMGGVSVNGTFSIVRPRGSASGTVDGHFQYYPQHRFYFGLHITDATNELKSAIGEELFFNGGLWPVTGAEVRITKPSS